MPLHTQPFANRPATAYTNRYMSSTVRIRNLHTRVPSALLTRGQKRAMLALLNSLAFAPLDECSSGSTDLISDIGLARAWRPLDRKHPSASSPQQPRQPRKPRAAWTSCSLSTGSTWLSCAKGLALVFGAPRLREAKCETVEQMRLVSTHCALDVVDFRVESNR